jgi:uncharacterized protein with HEPN domain
MLEAAKLARAYIHGKSKEHFLRDSQCQDAVVRRLEIIGEAARRVSEQTPIEPFQPSVGSDRRNVKPHDPRV